MDPTASSGAIRVPASPTQWKFWKVHQLKPEVNADNIVIIIPVEGDIRPALLERAVTTLITRHETLRTSFEVDGSTLVQRIAPGADVAITSVDITGTHRNFLSSDEAVGTVRRVMEDPFDFSVAPLLRATVVNFTMSDTRYLLVVVNHIVIDGWSIGIIRRELHQTLDALRNKKDPGLPTPVKQYRHVVEERNHEEGGRMSRQRDYWLRHLEGVSPRLSIPLIRPRSEVGSERLRDEPIVISDEVRSALADPSAHYGGHSISMLYTAALAAGTSVYSENGEVVIGIIYNGRASRHNHGVVGPLFNVLPLRISVKDNPTVRELMRNVKAEILHAYAHGEVPMEDIARTLGFGQAVLGDGPPLWEAAANVASLPPSEEWESGGFAEFENWLWAIRRDPVMERWDGRIMEIFGPSRRPGTAGALRYNSEILDPAESRLISTRISAFFHGRSALDVPIAHVLK